MSSTVYGGRLTKKRKHELLEIARAMEIVVDESSRKASLIRLIQDKLDVHKEVYIGHAQFRGLYVAPRVARKSAARRSLSPVVVYPNVSHQYGSVPQSDDSTDELYPTWVCASYPVARYGDGAETADRVDKVDRVDRMDKVDKAEKRKVESRTDGDGSDEPIYISSDTEPSSEHEEDDGGDDRREEEDAAEGVKERNGIDRTSSSQSTASTVMSTVSATPSTTFTARPTLTAKSTFTTSITLTAADGPASHSTLGTSNISSPGVCTGTTSVSHLALRTQDMSRAKTPSDPVDPMDCVTVCQSAARSSSSSSSSSSVLLWLGQQRNNRTWTSSDIPFDEHDLLAGGSVSDEMKARWAIRKRKAWDEFLWEEGERRASPEALSRQERREKMRDRDGSAGSSFRSVAYMARRRSAGSRDEDEAEAEVKEAKEAALDELAVERCLVDAEAASCLPVRTSASASASASV